MSFGYRPSDGVNVTWIAANEIAGLWTASLDTIARNLSEGSYSMSVRSSDRSGNEEVKTGRCQDYR